MTTYKCDKCSKEDEGTLKELKWIEIGGDNNSFYFKNYQSTRALFNFRPLHFCSEECFISHFIRK